MGKGRPFWAKYASTIDRRRLGAIAVLLLDTLFLVALLAPAKARQIEIVYTPVSSAVFEPPHFKFDPAEDNSSANRSVYPYSVIPGGARTAIELRNAVTNDSIVRAHYADFAVANTRVERLEKTQAFYVSYRIGNSVFWTKNPMTIAAGEPVLTDGSNMARIRCGNRLSVVPVAPVSNIEPTPEAMEAPAGSVLLASIAAPAELPLTTPPLAAVLAPLPVPAPSTPGFFLPFSPFFPMVPGGGSLPPETPGTPLPPTTPPSGPTPPPTPPLTPTPPATPPVATPEPSAALLLAAGLGCLFLLKRWRSCEPYSRFQFFSVRRIPCSATVRTRTVAFSPLRSKCSARALPI
jgi:hypothetical protein